MALAPLRIMPSGLGKMALKLAVPVSVDISPLAVSTLPFSGYTVPSASNNTAGASLLSFSLMVAPGVAAENCSSCFSFNE